VVRQMAARGWGLWAQQAVIRWPAAALLACAPLLYQWSCTVIAACCAALCRQHMIAGTVCCSTCCPLEHVDACAVYSMVRACHGCLYQARPGCQPACWLACPNQRPCMPPLASLCSHLRIYVRSCLTLAVAEWILKYWHACCEDATTAD
jgi:hypothetical protein